MITQLPNLPLIQERMWRAIKDKEEYQNYHCVPDFDIYVFPQLWSTTALGFPGIGGQSVTKAYTTVLIDEKTNYAGVFFENELAYLTYNTLYFIDDVNNHQMESVDRCNKYLIKEDI